MTGGSGSDPPSGTGSRQQENIHWAMELGKKYAVREQKLGAK